MNALALALLPIPFWGILIKSSVAMALAVFGCQLLGRRSAAQRHCVWLLALAAALLLPIATWLLPPFSLPVLPEALNHYGLAGTEAAGSPSSALSFRPRFAGHDEVGRALPADSDPQSSTSVTPAVRKLQGLDESRPGSMGLEQVFGLAWLLGTMFGLAVLVLALVRQSIALRRLRSINDDDWLNSVAVASRAIALKGPIVTLESETTSVPAVAGVFWPRLIVPSNWRAWSPAQRHCILLHELAHVKRRDVATQWLGHLALIVHWFNPLVWHAVRQLRVERELASDDCVLLAGQAASDYAEQLVQTLRSCRPARLALGVGMAHSARLDQRVLAILDPHRRRAPLGPRSTVFLAGAVSAMVSVLGAATFSSVAIARPPAAPEVAAAGAAEANPVWKENYTVEYPGSLPVSVAFSADGKMLLTGDTAGEVMNLIFTDHEPRWQWKAKVGGSHAAVAFSADQKQVYATTKDGARILDVATGKEQGRVEATDSNPSAIGVFPNKTLAEDYTREQIVFGNGRGYFVESWARGKLPDTLSTIETSTVPKDAKPADNSAVPLAVDPQGRSAIMTGPIDPTGEAGGVKGKNVLWAYVCGDYAEGSPGNRVMPGHAATVVAAAWAKDGSTAVTGDAAGRVIVWDAKTMKEVRRLELGRRVAALAISDDGKRTAVWVTGKAADVYVWETARPTEMQHIHTEHGDFSGTDTYASLAFSPDGKQLAGCAIATTWLNRLGELVGKVRVWELSAAPKAQPAPKHSYLRAFPQGSKGRFVVLDNGSMLVPEAERGGVDFRRVADGQIQARIVLGKFSIGNIKLSSDRRWLALEQHASAEARDSGGPQESFDVGVYESVLLPKATIPACTQLLDIAAGGKIVAVVREKQIELWDTGTTKRLKAAPFQHARIAEAAFSPDGGLLAIADGQELVLWKWEQGTHERIDLRRGISSLAFSPNGRLLAVGLSAHESIQIVGLETRQIVQTLTIDNKELMNVRRVGWSQGGRVLIACVLPIQRDAASAVSANAANRINFWDMADGSLAHQLMTTGALPEDFAVSPNGRMLLVTLANRDVKLSGWRLDGENSERDADPQAPAAPAATPR